VAAAAAAAAAVRSGWANAAPASLCRRAERVLHSQLRRGGRGMRLGGNNVYYAWLRTVSATGVAPLLARGTARATSPTPASPLPPSTRSRLLLYPSLTARSHREFRLRHPLPRLPQPRVANPLAAPRQPTEQTPPHLY